ncbi:multidrug effflux MFS transporter [Microbaculum marinisediminis]|uniref:Bcr/CflA family efflux transporter n=1 Tax=Microbaculum marinisediminis TaxID=2931392 RepID=A0AAW5QY69_9HYPH|nr:multidrug effflux MFS transporter [Microbaculum sp. A6E488]MCT8972082.1 multidrug effflux MFS transporter [Microbaculum sp. A6E488]
MTFRPDTIALTALLGLLTALGPLSTDMYLPSLPSLTTELGSTPTEGQLTLSAFLIGFASTQIFYGPLSDRYGRRPALLVGLSIFVLATVLCAIAQSMPLLIAARFAQALGASGPIVLARAIARDLYSGRRAGQELAMMASIMGIVPTVAPAIGGVLEITFGWRSTFIVAAAIGLILFAAVALRLPETRPDSGAPSTPLGMIRIFGRLIRDARFLVYVSLVCLSYGCIFVFISVSSFILQGLYGLSPIGFGVSFGLCSLGYIGGTIAGRHVTGRFGIDAGIAVGITLMALGGVATLAVVIADVGGVYSVVGMSTVVFAGVGAALAQSMAGALMPFPGNAGAASSLMGVCQMTFSALAGVLVAGILDAGLFANQAMPLAVALAALGLAAAAVYLGGWKVRAAARAGE